MIASTQTNPLPGAFRVESTDTRPRPGLDAATAARPARRDRGPVLDLSRHARGNHAGFGRCTGREDDATEHQARGLLNLTVLLARCLEGAASPAEKSRWRREMNEANDRLERLYSAGLPRTFLSDTSPAARPAR